METLPALAERLARLFGPLDLLALAVFLAAWLGMSWAIERPATRRPSTSILMEDYRRRWMAEAARREMRIFDATLLSTLRGGTGFFASASLIMIGAVAAVLGQAERLLGVVRDLAAIEADVLPVWEAKLVVVLVLLVNAFLKFVWSHRLFGYCAVLMGAMPPPGEAGAGAAINRATLINNAAARSFNRGLRTLYFTLAALAWLLGPVPLVAATLLTALMLHRREFRSRSRAVLLEGAGEGRAGP
jgi:uncharacterized membrane protein